MKFIFVLVLCSVLHASPVMSLWEYAVTTKSKIVFYDDKWSEITSAAHQFDEISSIAFDESEEEIYFSNQVKNNESIFSLKLSRDNDHNHMMQKLLSQTENETIDGMAFDPVDRALYWTDKQNRKIFKIMVDDPKAQPQVVIDLANGTEIPDGIAIDICRRKLYWTNSNHKNPSVEQSSLLGGERKILVDSNLFLPHGIVVDQYSHRLYWVVDQEGRHYSVESSNFEGNDRQVIVKGLNNIPLNLAVTKDLIFWTDITHNAIWNISKTASGESDQPTKIQNYSQKPKGIVTRIGLLSKLENNVDCADQVKKIKTHLLSSKSLDNNEPLDKGALKKQQEYCLHNGEYSPKSGICVCKVGFTGARCDVDDCHNYCVHGTCGLNSMGFAHCTCQEGFYGERCQSSRCTNFCLNGGHCQIRDERPYCECPDNHSGIRCETNTTEICLIYCKYGRNNTDWNAPPQCPDSCDEEAIANYQPQKLDFTTSNQMCSSKYNLSLIITILGVVIALTLTLLIVKAIRRIYKPARPRIKKTFLVQKKISQTPLTSRPVATEQCEITIENCCNMNICDTPCFDPKLLQQNLSRDSSKDDKKILINHMDDDLY